MGQNISMQPKLSGEVTTNRIRTVCQANSRPEQLKHFEASLLANDLNTLGFNIPIKNKNNKQRKSGEICQDIRKAAFPDVNDVCMIKAGEKGDHMHAVETLVKMFNENYGANIQLYKDPTNKSRGKRSVDSICDDLYITADRVTRNLTDHPNVIKDSLRKQLAELQQARQSINSQFGVLMKNVRLAQDNDKVNTDLETIKNMQRVIDGELNNQVYNIGTQFNELTKQFEPLKPGSDETISGLRPSEPFGQMRNTINEYKKVRFLDNRVARDNRVANLVKIAQLSAPAVNKCEECIRTFGEKISMSELGTEETNAKLAKAAKRAIANNPGNKTAYDNIIRCYQRLTGNPDSCRSAVEFASNVESGSILDPSVGVFNEDKALTQVASLLMGAVRDRRDGKKRPSLQAIFGSV